ncbi:TonB-dependent receptor [Synoicihabitans lomoniglobus]|uniref:TonB-dependent siderophore receptor n=1 Tax=Synoicihabitans lomoniglobus TaxID=2909285 RepID=A0AAF0CPM4_9BACT|nr:TonB-dependent siderophore receptor [Opitutaceae bacterium LMO-M01]WED65509.1 TonB-dependent siderophore receptor [Opitutaceae bacterium LMO-M01]
MKSTIAPSASFSNQAPRRSTPFAALLVANSIATVAATAQTTATTPSAADDDVVELEQQTVEGERVRQLASPKFNAPLLDTPQTVTVISQRIMEEQAASSLRDILRNSPGITFQAGEGGTPAGDQMTIRGFSARTDMFVDGVRDLGGYARDSFNLEQVEVAKGPTSATAGRGSTGGSVNLVSKSPHGLERQTASVAVGTDSYKRATLDINQPLNEDQAARVNLMWHDAGVPGRDVVENTSWGVAPSFALGLSKPTKVTFAYQHLEQDNVPDYGMPRQTYSYDPVVPFSNWYGLKARDFEKIEQDLATVTVEHQGDGFSLRNLTRYGRTYRDSVTTSPRLLSGTTDTIRRNDWKSRDQTDEVFSNQTHLAADLKTGDINHALSAGVEYSRENEINYTRVEDPATVFPETDVYNPNPDDPYNGNITRNGAYNEGSGETISLYAFDNVFAGQQWQVFAGARYDHFTADYDTVDDTGAKTSYGRTDAEISGRLGFIYKPTTNSSFYVGYANAFNPSAEGLSLASRRTDLSDVDPEQTDSYELGVKWDTMESRLSLGASLFRTVKTNARTPGIDPNDPPIVLDGEESVSGVELSAAGRITRGWDVFAGFAYMDSEVEASNTAGLEGVELGLTPRKTFNFWSTYALPGGITIGGGTQYMDSVPRNTAEAAETIPSYWLFNAMASYAFNEQLTLRLNATNLADETYIDRVGGGHHIPGQGRQFILSAYYTF